MKAVRASMSPECKAARRRRALRSVEISTSPRTPSGSLPGPVFPEQPATAGSPCTNCSPRPISPRCRMLPRARSCARRGLRPSNRRASPRHNPARMPCLTARGFVSWWTARRSISLSRASQPKLPRPMGWSPAQFPPGDQTLNVTLDGGDVQAVQLQATGYTTAEELAFDVGSQLVGGYARVVGGAWSSEQSAVATLVACK